MRLLIFLFTLVVFSNSFAQAPPVLQWSKTYGGSLHDEPAGIVALADGSFVTLGISTSNDGDVSGHHGSQYFSDIWVTKFDAVGNIIWQRSYGGSDPDLAASIKQTSDGGFIVIGTVSSNDGDVSGNHGTIYSTDIWVLKIDASGNIIWQRCYGGSEKDYGQDILEINGGYMIIGGTRSNDGDVSGLHGIGDGDLWVAKIDATGNILWQRCYGGSDGEGGGYMRLDDQIRKAPGGGFIISCHTSSIDGDISQPRPGTGSGNGTDAWILKITDNGAIVWDKCFGGNYGDVFGIFTVNNDGSIVLAGLTYSDDLPGALDNVLDFDADAYMVKLDMNGNLLWSKVFGGTGNDIIRAVTSTSDGGYLLTGTTTSADVIVCKKNAAEELWLVKITGSGEIQWNRTYGGSKRENGLMSAITPTGDCLVVSLSTSSDGDVGNNRGLLDYWVTKFSFTGVPILPSITITKGEEENFCTGKEIQFIAKAIDGGTKPSYQWRVNGINIGGNNDTIVIPNIYNNDVISCFLTSNSNCVDLRGVLSNSITIPVIPPPNPNKFLPADTALCFNEKLFIKTDSTYISYKWSNGSTAATIILKKPGMYWLQVTDDKKCIGRDSIIIYDKDCIKGVYIPNAFTPNGDGENDQFTPLFFQVTVKRYRFIVYDRWGNIIFETTKLNQGWDGRVKGNPATPGTYVWICMYQLEGEPVTNKKGSVLLLRPY